MKKILALVLILALSLSIFACGKKTSDVEQNDPTQQEDYDPTDWIIDEDGNEVNINDPEYIAKDDDNYISKEEKEDEKNNQLTLEEVEKIPQTDEEIVITEDEKRAMNGWGPEDVEKAALPKTWTCETLNLDTLEMTSTSGTFASGDKLVPELKKIEYQYTLDSKMMSDGMNYLLTMAVLNDEIIRFQYSINLNKKTVKEVQVSSDTYTKVYKFKY